MRTGSAGCSEPQRPTPNTRAIWTKAKPENGKRISARGRHRVVWALLDLAQTDDAVAASRLQMRYGKSGDIPCLVRSPPRPAQGGDPLVSTPEEYAADIARETAKWGPLIRRLGLKVE
jgi:hypothetical protein